MASIVINMNGCDLAHETNCASPEFQSSGKDAVAKYSKPARAGSRHLKAVAAATEEAIEKIAILSSAFPKCP